MDVRFIDFVGDKVRVADALRDNVGSGSREFERDGDTDKDETLREPVSL